MWSSGDYKEVMYAFYISPEKPAGSYTENTFRIWRSRNHTVRMYVYNIYTIQICNNNPYQNYMKLERIIHEQEWPSTFGHWLWPGAGKF